MGYVDFTEMMNMRVKGRFGGPEEFNLRYVISVFGGPSHGDT